MSLTWPNFYVAGGILGCMHNSSAAPFLCHGVATWRSSIYQMRMVFSGNVVSHASSAAWHTACLLQEHQAIVLNLGNARIRKRCICGVHPNSRTLNIRNDCLMKLLKNTFDASFLQPSKRWHFPIETLWTDGLSAILGPQAHCSPSSPLKLINTSPPASTRTTPPVCLVVALCLSRDPFMLWQHGRMLTT